MQKRNLILFAVFGLVVAMAAPAGAAGTAGNADLTQGGVFAMSNARDGKYGGRVLPQC